MNKDTPARRIAKAWANLYKHIRKVDLVDGWQSVMYSYPELMARHAEATDNIEKETP